MGDLLFATTMFFAPFVRSLRFATVIVALTGVPWALSCWAPFALMGVEINRLGISSSSAAGAATLTGGAEYHAVNVEEEDDFEIPNLSNGTLLRQRTNEADPEIEGIGERAGIYLGVLNVYTTLPQFLATFISYVIFSILEPGKNAESSTEDSETHKWLDLKTDAPNAISVCLFIGGLSALIASEATRRLRKVH